jgi:hypothetical protein
MTAEHERFAVLIEQSRSIISNAERLVRRAQVACESAAKVRKAGVRATVAKSRALSPTNTKRLVKELERVSQDVGTLKAKIEAAATQTLVPSLRQRRSK